MTTLTLIDFRLPTLRRLLLTSVLVLLVTGCVSNPPTVGDSMKSERDHYGQISEKWADGQKLVSKGNKKIKNGNKQILKGKENIAEGEDMIQRGERMMRDSEQEYELKKTPA